MRKKENILKWTIFIAGFFCLLFFVIVRWEKLNLRFIRPDMQYGDLYIQCNVDHFRIKKNRVELPLKKYYTRNAKKIDQSQYLLFGDSFCYYPQRAFPILFSDSVEELTYFGLSSYPLIYLKKSKKAHPKKRYLIYETVERSIHQVFNRPHVMNGRKAKPKQAKKRKSIKPMQCLSSVFRPLNEEVFPRDMERNYAYFLDRSVFTNFLGRKLNTLRFNLFGYISDKTPVYSVNPPMLFYYQTVNEKPTAYCYSYTEKQIELYCDHIAMLYDTLKHYYNVEMIFMPVPSKVTIHGDLAGLKDYNRLLPRIYKKLDHKQIPYVNLYEPFSKAKGIIYHPSDTHWNRKGLNIALEKLLEKLRRIQN